MFAMMKQWLVNLYQDEEGASAIEYALIVAMVALVLVTLMPGMRTAITAVFTNIQNALTGTGTA
ncbi:Flp family type IVb pilin [Methylobacillus methanolivorans]|uniref:Flp family type IVb pilin n=1 Tax=Methylobacillus methanolivorans TaxID=1848927 RepID=A0ABW8GJB8_9PROT